LLGPSLGGHCRLTAGVSACGSVLGFALHHEGLLVVVFFTEGGQPITTGSWILICPVTVASRENIVAGENRAVWWGDGDGLRHYFN
jgi:hypothetical protein